jgi:hypothetical protein
MANRAIESEPSDAEREAGIVKAVDPVPSEDAPSQGKSEPEAPSKVRSGPTFGQRIGRFFAFLLRLVTLVILLSLLSLALYVTLPWLYQKFITPVEQNTAQVRELQSKQQQTEQQLADLQTKMQTFETAQNGHDGTLTKLDERMGDIEMEIEARTQSLAALEKMQSKLQAQNESNSAELQRQVNLLKAMELLSRARLSMYESNFGLARQDVQIARDLLAALEPDASDSLAKDLEEVLRRLDLTLSNLPDFPVAASDDLDIAWQVLLSGLPEAQPTVAVTTTPASTPSVTPAVTLTPTIQATPSLVVTP